MNLNKLRSKIDVIDDKILELIDNRLDITNEIGLLKLKNKQTIYDPLREKYILKKLDSKRYKNLNSEHITAIAKNCS